MILNTIIGMMATIAIIGLFGCLWKFFFVLNWKKIRKHIELMKYKKTCRIILYVSISCFALFLLVIGLWFRLIYPTLK